MCTKHPFETLIQTHVRLNALRMKGSQTSSTASIKNDQFIYPSNDQFITHIHHRVGLPLNLSNDIPIKCPHCSKDVDIRGYHFANCIKRPLKTQIHNATVKAFANSLPSGSDVQYEIRGSGIGNYGRRPMDFALNLSGYPKQLGADLTVISPFAKQNEKYFKDNKGHNRIKALEYQKIDNLKGSVNFSVYDYFPVVCTIYGGIGPKARQLCVELADAHGAESVSLRNWYLKLFHDTLSFTIQQQYAKWTTKFVYESYHKAVESDHGVIIPRKYFPRVIIPITPLPIRPVVA